MLGAKGRGTVLDALGSYDNALVVGSLSKAFSCFGGFIGCTAEMKELLKMRSNTFIFGGPVPPPYLEAILAVLDIIESDEYETIRARLDANVRRLAGGLTRLGLAVLGGPAADRLGAGRRRGRHARRRPLPVRPRLLRPVGRLPGGALSRRRAADPGQRQPPTEAIDGLLDALDALRKVVALPGPEALTTVRGVTEREAGHARWEAGGLALVMLAAVATLAMGEALIARGMRQAGDVSASWWAGVRAAASNGWVVSGVLAARASPGPVRDRPVPGRPQPGDAPHRRVLPDRSRARAVLPPRGGERRALARDGGHHRRRGGRRVG